MKETYTLTLFAGAVDRRPVFEGREFTSKAAAIAHAKANVQEGEVVDVNLIDGSRLWMQGTVAVRENGKITFHRV